LQEQHPERKTRKLKRGASRTSTTTGTPRQDWEAGFSGARRKPNAARSGREGGFTQAQAGGDREPGGPQAVGSWQPQEAKAVRPEQSAEAQAKGRLPECRGRSASSGNQHEGQTEQWAQVQGNVGSKACQRAASERRRRGESRMPERGRPEGWPEGMAGDEGLMPSVECRSRKAAGGWSGCEGRKL
jgi:hypothetical protein